MESKQRKDAFSVSRSTLFEWQRRLRQLGSRMRALEPRSRRPKHCHAITTRSFIIERICAMRTAFPHYRPAKISSILKEEKRIIVSTTTIRKVIKRYDLPAAPRQHVARRRQKQKPRKPRELTAKQPGELVSMDTIEIQKQGKKKYIITALDHATRIALARTHARHSSKQARDLLQWMQLALGAPLNMF